jgi:hypothetical protein
MANGEADIKTAAKGGDAGKVAEKYEDYKASMEAANQTPRPLKDILGK